MTTLKTICAIAVFCIVCHRTAGAVEADVRVTLGEQPYFLGEVMPVTISVTNRSGRAWVNFGHGEGDPDRRRYGLVIRLTNLGDGQQLPQKGGIDFSDSSVRPGSAEHLKADLRSLFAIPESGRYQLQVRILHYDYEVSGVSGQEVYEAKLVLDIQSPPVEFEVRGVDEELLARVVRLLKAGKRGEILEGLELLAGARAELFRRAAPSLPPLFRSNDKRVRAAALKAFLARAELSEELSDEELYEALDLASRESDAAIRLAAAKALNRAGRDLARGRILRTFIDKRIGPWIEGEASEECRTCLVTENALKLDVMTGIISEDPSPQVRAAAIRRLSDFAPEALLKIAGTLGDLSGEVEMDGKRQPLADFVAKEIEKARERVPKPAGGAKGR